MSNEKLKLCPFCGEKVGLMDEWTVCCKHCGAETTFNAADDVAEAWNMRKGEAKNDR